MNDIADIREPLQKIVAQLKRGSFRNENQVKQGIVLPLLHALGWNVFDVEQVAPEYATDSGRADFALFETAKQPRRLCAFVEAKAVGMIKPEGERQLFRYAFDEGAPILILTDGREWNFYLTAGQGKYHERQFYKLDVLEHSPADCAGIFQKYLLQDAVVSGGAQKSAQSTLKSRERQTAIANAMPQAWRTVLEEADVSLRDLLSDATERICGYKPESENMETFLLSKIKNGSVASCIAGKAKRRDAGSGGDDVFKPRKSIVGFVYKKKKYGVKSAVDALKDGIVLLQNGNPDFLPALQARTSTARKQLVSRKKEELFLSSPHLADEHKNAERIKTRGEEWWLNKNHSAATIATYLRICCEVAGLEYGKDFQVVER